MTDLDKEPKKVEEPIKNIPDVVSEKDDGLDDFGYEKPKQEMKDGKESKENEKSSQKNDEGLLDQKIEPASGYEKEPQKDAGSKEPEKKEEIVAAPVAKDEEFDIKEPGDLLPEEINIIKEFVKKAKVSKEVGQSLVEFKKQEVAKLQVAMKDHEEKRKQEILKERRAWYEEMESDKKFGGENFKTTLTRVEKVMQDFMPEMKKKLTDSKGMLPPYAMRGLAAIGNHLYGSENLVNGEPSKTEKDSKEEKRNPLDYYSNS